MGRIYPCIGLYNAYGFRSYADAVSIEWQKQAHFFGKILIWDDSAYKLKQPRMDSPEDLASTDFLQPFPVVDMRDLYTALNVRYAPMLFQPVW